MTSDLNGGHPRPGTEISSPINPLANGRILSDLPRAIRGTSGRTTVNSAGTSLRNPDVC
jgi:hypothetical protein